MVFPVRGVAEASEDIVLSQVGEVGKDFLVAHARSKVRQHVVHRDAHTSDTGLPAALAGLEGDDVLIVHEGIIRRDGWFYKHDSRTRRRERVVGSGSQLECQ